MPLPVHVPPFEREDFPAPPAREIPEVQDVLVWGGKVAADGEVVSVLQEALPWEAFSKAGDVWSAGEAPGLDGKGKHPAQGSELVVKQAPRESLPGPLPAAVLAEVPSTPGHDRHLEHGPFPPPATCAGTMYSDTTSCAGMRWSVPELVTNLVTDSLQRKFCGGQLFEMNGGLGRD